MGLHIRPPTRGVAESGKGPGKGQGKEV